ncbi:MAG: hypothetical protein V1696_02930, partial [Candidatus Jorgensenbacteria bacterium]
YPAHKSMKTLTNLKVIASRLNDLYQESRLVTFMCWVDIRLSSVEALVLVAKFPSRARLEI